MKVTSEGRKIKKKRQQSERMNATILGLQKNGWSVASQHCCEEQEGKAQCEYMHKNGGFPMWLSTEKGTKTTTLQEMHKNWWWQQQPEELCQCEESVGFSDPMSVRFSVPKNIFPFLFPECWYKACKPILLYRPQEPQQSWLMCYLLRYFKNTIIGVLLRWYLSLHAKWSICTHTHNHC